MPSARGIDALRVFGRQLIEYLDLAPAQPVALGMGVTHGAAGAFGRDGLGDVSLGVCDHRLQVLHEPGISDFGVYLMNSVDM